MKQIFIYEVGLMVINHTYRITSIVNGKYKSRYAILEEVNKEGLEFIDINGDNVLIKNNELENYIIEEV